MRIIPAIDLIDGKCVRLTKGDYNTKKVYNEDPLEVARQFEDHGIKYLHLVDLDGAREKRVVNYRVLEHLATRTSLNIDFGGGLNSDADLHIAFDSGAQQVTGGSIAVRRRDLFLKWLEHYGSEKIILGADANNEKVAISGWQEETEEKLIPFIKSYMQKGIRYVICTDISKDGMLEGPALELYRKIMDQTRITKTTISMNGVEDQIVAGIKLVASGGITHIDDLAKLKTIGCEGAILGKAIYERTIDLKDLEQFILAS